MTTRTEPTRTLAEQAQEYLNMLDAPVSKEFTVEITRRIGKDMIMFVYRGKLYSAFYENGSLNKKSISRFF